MIGNNLTLRLGERGREGKGREGKGREGKRICAGRFRVDLRCNYSNEFRLWSTFLKYFSRLLFCPANCESSISTSPSFPLALRLVCPMHTNIHQMPLNSALDFLTLSYFP